jgi:hypothetical protein
MKLFVNGCSFSHGHKDFTDDMRSPDWVWPSLISDNFEETVNLAWHGGSNHRIVRTTLDFFDKVRDGDEWLAIIQWTSIYSRTELHDEETDTYFGCCPGSSNPVLAGEDRVKFITIPTRIFRAVDAYQKTAHTRSDKQMMESFIQQQFVLSEFFKRKNVKFLYIGMSSKSVVPRNFQNPLQQYLPNDNRLLSISHFVNNTTLNLIESSTDFHPNKAGHQVIANYITNEETIYERCKRLHRRSTRTIFTFFDQRC